MTGLVLFDEAGWKGNCASEQPEDRALCCLFEVWTLVVDHLGDLGACLLLWTPLC